MMKLNKNSSSVLIACCILFSMMIGNSDLVAADPSIKKPNEPLMKLNAVEEGGQWWDKANKLEIEIVKGLEKLSKSKTPDPELLNKLCASVTLLNMYVDRLKQLGETAGTDWHFRNMEYDRQMNDGLSKLWSTTKGEQARQKATEKMKSTAKARMKQVEAIQNLLRDGKVWEAEERFDKAVYDFYMIGGVLTTVDREPFYKVYESVHSPLTTQTTTLRTKQVSEAFQAEAQQLLAKYVQAVKELQNAALSLEQSGTATYLGQATSGPGVVEAFVTDWGASHIGLLRGMVLDRAAPVGGSPYGSSGPTAGKEDHWTESAKNLANDSMKAIQQLIEGDAKHNSSAMAIDNHTAYIRILGQYMNRMSDDTWNEKLEDSLRRLAKKGNLDSAVKNYEDATKDLLRWREKAATQQAEAAKKSSVELRQKIKDSLVMNETTPGIYRNAESKNYLPTIFTGVPKLMPVIQTQLEGANVFAPNVVRLEGEKGIWMTQLISGTYCKLPANFGDSIGNSALPAELLVDASHPPLTLYAAKAWSTSIRNEYLAVGGKVDDVAVEANLSRIANLPAVASPLVSFGKIVGSGRGGQAVTGITLRCSIKPEWVQHRYYFQKLGE